jgi:hypothetical protein
MNAKYLIPLAALIAGFPLGSAVALTGTNAVTNAKSVPVEVMPKIALLEGMVQIAVPSKAEHPFQVACTRRYVTRHGRRIALQC